LDFHLSRGVDFFVAMDNLSVDCTPEIPAITKVAASFTTSSAAGRYSQHRWVTRDGAARLYAVRRRLVINADADEFWCRSRAT